MGQFIGVYSSLEEVEKAKERLRTQMGIRDYPDGFRVSCMLLNKEYDDPEFMTKGG